MSTKRRFRVLVGITYADDTKRAEPGDIISDLPEKSVRWLLEQQVIEPVTETGRVKRGEAAR